MKKQIKKEKKLSLKKLQLVKISDPKKIFGGTKQYLNGCNDPDNGSGNQQSGIGGVGF